MKKNTLRKMMVGALAGVMLTGCLTGCAPKDGTTVAEIGSIDVPYGEANFYSRYIQSNYESYASGMGYAGEDFWQLSLDGTSTLYESVKENVQGDLENMYVLYQNRDQYGVELTDEEVAAIEAAADAFIAANSEETLDFMSASKENIVNVLTGLTVQSKMYDAITADVSEEVTDEEALQKGMVYVSIPYTASASSVSGSGDAQTQEVTEALSEALTAANEEEKKTEGEQFIKDVKGMTVDELKAYAEEKGYTAAETTFGGDSTSPVAELCEEAFGLKVGETTKLYKNEDIGAYYMAMLTSEYDEDATESKKTTIVQNRYSDTYDAAIEAMKEGMTISWKDDVWSTIDFLTGGVSPATEEDKVAGMKVNEDPTKEIVDGDTVNIDFVGKVDGEAFDGGTATEQILTIGSGSYIDDFEQQLIGAHPGDDVEVNVTFPEDYSSTDLAGKDAVFEVHVNGIYVDE